MRMEEGGRERGRTRGRLWKEEYEEEQHGWKDGRRIRAYGRRGGKYKRSTKKS